MECTLHLPFDIHDYLIYSSPIKISDISSVGIINSKTPIYPGATSYLSKEITSLPSSVM